MQSDSVQSAAAYAEDFIRRVIGAFGPREAGSEAERKAQEMAAEEMRPWVDTVETESFTVHPKAFLGFMPVAALLLTGAVLVFWVGGAAAGLGPLVLSAAALFVTVLQFVMYRRFLDPVFPARTSHNVIGVRRATGEVKRRIIVSGHMDSAYEWPYSYYVGPWLVKVVLIGAILGGLTVFACSVARLLAGSGADVTEGAWLLAGVVQTVFVPWFVALFFFPSFHVVVPGANDNLTGVAASLAVIKLLHEAGETFAHTEVAVISMGSEEAGLRGANAYAAAHLAETRAVETVFLALETFRDVDHMAIYARDMSGTVRNDPRVCRLLKLAGERCGRALKYETIYAGASDAAAFSQAGIPAAALAAMDPAPPRYYHTRLDDVDNLDPRCIELGIRITREAVRQFDETGLPAEA